jgi:hypothetical protein
MGKNGPIEAQPAKPRKKKGRGCLISFLVIAVILLVGAALIFRVPQKIGLVKSPSEKLYIQPNDADKAALVLDSLHNSGLSAQGLEVYVMPVKNTDHNTAIIVLDASKGFNFSGGYGSDPVEELVRIAAKAQAQGINRTAVVYYDDSGKALVTITVKTEDMAAYAHGKLTDAELMERVDLGANNIVALTGALASQLK